MQQGPSWEANSSSASQRFPRIVWKPKVRHRVHRNPSPVPILSQINTVQAPTLFLENPSYYPPTFQVASLLQLSYQIPVCFSHPYSTCYMPNQSTFSSFIRTIFGDWRRRSSSCHVLPSPVSSENDFGVHFLHLRFLLFILRTIWSTRHPAIGFTPLESDAFTL